MPLKNVPLGILQSAENIFLMHQIMLNEQMDSMNTKRKKQTRTSVFGRKMEPQTRMPANFLTLRPHVDHFSLLRQTPWALSAPALAQGPLFQCCVGREWRARFWSCAIWVQVQGHAPVAG